MSAKSKDSPRGSAASSRVSRGGGMPRYKRTASDVSSSPSSEIQVGPPPIQSPSAVRHPAMDLTNGAAIKGDTNIAAAKKCRVVDGHMLIIPLQPDQAALLTEKQSEAALIDGDVTGADDNPDGRNARGTYSREYTLSRPEIKWVHRGQGRYLPAEEIKRDPPAEPQRRSRHSRNFQDEPTADTPNIKTEASDGLSVPTPLRLRRPLSPREPEANDVNGLSGSAPQSADHIVPRRRAPRDSLTDALSHPPQYGLRHRTSYPETPASSDVRAARLARRSKLMPSIEKSGQISLRNSDSEGDSDDDNDRKHAGTYNRDYVESHPNEEFHHTGNGWYRRGPRPSIKPRAKEPNPERLTLTQSRDGTLSFPGNQSVHKDDLDKYPGMEFHHKGNGWYKPGPDPTGKRKSVNVQATDSEDDDEESEDDSEDDGSVNALGGRTVDKAYKEAHPHIEWVHRGNGRYMRKADVMDDSIGSAPPPPEPAPVALERRKSGAQDRTETFSKDYVRSHPNEEFYHTGNARWKRGPRPSAKPSIQEPESESEDDDPNALYDKAHVEAHPHQEFHHRGQGRYARGPRPGTTPAREPSSEDNGGDDIDTGELVDTSYVEAHPDVNFYHKGQGRWAFGLPPPGSHNKVAVRGPGAKEKMNSRTSQEQNDEEPADAPALTALVLRADGPDKFPKLQWHYRGGGKWARITKLELDALNRPAKPFKVPSVSRFGGKKHRFKSSDSPAAQLERESAAAELATGGTGEVGGLNSVTRFGQKPKVRRGRRTFQAMQQDGERSKDTSKSHSQVPTPKPRMLEPHEDVLFDDDLVSIIGDIASPPPGEEDPTDRLLRIGFPALNTHKIMGSLTRFDPAVRQLSVLHAVAANAQRALDDLQKEYLDLDRTTAPHAKIPRRPAKGGRVPAEPQVFEDRKEAELYDYVFDPRRIGYQDAEAQRIIRDAEGRELRKRRNRSGVEPTDTVPGWRFGEKQLTQKRQSRQPNRFDSAADQQPPRKRLRVPNGIDSNAGSLTPDRAATPLGGLLQGSYQVPTTGRWAGHVPKRIQQLRDESVVTVRSENGTVTKVRKGRPPGSKNLHRRRDAGIPKGPRRKKVEGAVEREVYGEVEGAGDGDDGVGLSDVLMGDGGAVDGVVA